MCLSLPSPHFDRLSISMLRSLVLHGSVTRSQFCPVNWEGQWHMYPPMAPRSVTHTPLFWQGEGLHGDGGQRSSETWVVVRVVWLVMSSSTDWGEIEGVREGRREGRREGGKGGRERERKEDGSNYIYSSTDSALI